MGKRWMLGLVAVFAVVAVGGIGFAQFTANAYVNGSATGGIAEIHFSGSPTVTNTGYTSCSPGFSSYNDVYGYDNVMTITANYFAPGDWCQVSEYAVNGGSVGLSVSSGSGPYITGVSGGSGFCTASEWTITDNGPWGDVAPGGTFVVTVTVTLNSGAGNECQGATAGLSDTLTGTSYA